VLRSYTVWRVAFRTLSRSLNHARSDRSTRLQPRGQPHASFSNRGQRRPCTLLPKAARSTRRRRAPRILARDAVAILRLAIASSTVTCGSTLRFLPHPVPILPGRASRISSSGGPRCNTRRRSPPVAGAIDVLKVSSRLGGQNTGPPATRRPSLVLHGTPLVQRICGEHLCPPDAPRWLSHPHKRCRVRRNRPACIPCAGVPTRTLRPFNCGTSQLAGKPRKFR